MLSQCKLCIPAINADVISIVECGIILLYNDVMMC